MIGSYGSTGGIRGNFFVLDRIYPGLDGLRRVVENQIHGIAAGDPLAIGFAVTLVGPRARCLCLAGAARDPGGSAC